MKERAAPKPSPSDERSEAKNSTRDIRPGDYTRLGRCITMARASISPCSRLMRTRSSFVCSTAPDAETDRITLPEFTNEIWHGYVPGLKAGQLYGFRVHGPFEPEKGHRFNANKLLIDPYARLILGDIKGGQATYGYKFEDEAGDLSFDRNRQRGLDAQMRRRRPRQSRQRGARPSIPWSRAIFYETHVRGFTKLHPGRARESAGHV